MGGYGVELMIIVNSVKFDNSRYSSIHGGY